VTTQEFERIFSITESHLKYAADIRQTTHLRWRVELFIAGRYLGRLNRHLRRERRNLEAMQ
jgi:hypothetical protein